MGHEHLVFGSFRLDPVARKLWHGEREIKLQPRPLAVLLYLAWRPGQVVPKEELLKQVWQGTYVTKTALKVCIRAIRKALEDEVTQPRYLETVGWEGYRFLTQVVSSQYSVVSSREETRGWRLEARSSSPLAPGPQHPTPSLVGRETELAQLHQWLAKAMNGERQVVFVTGEPGIGKTTLVDAFLFGVRSPEEFGVEEKEESQKSKVKGQKAKIPDLSPAPSPQPLAPVFIGRGQCLEQYGEGEPYLPVLEALGQMCRGPDGLRVVSGLAQYAPTWLVQMPALVSAEEVEVLQRKVAGATRKRMLREMAEALEALTAERALVLVLEDLHWSDHSTVELLAYLAQRREPAKLLVVGTYRPTDVVARQHPLKGIKQELSAHGDCTELRVELLTRAAVEEYVATRLAPGTVPAAFPTLIYHHTDGNALFMVSVVEYCLQHGLLTQDGGQWHLQVKAEALEVPESVHQMIAKQVDRLTADEQRVLELASVAGSEFAVASLATALHSDLAAVEKTCEELAHKSHFLQEAGVAEWPDGTLSGRYTFRHVLYQHVVYERIAEVRRVRLHRLIGERQEQAYGARAKELAAELAVHFERGRDDWRAVRYLRQAAENAVRRYAHVEAIAALQNALLHVEGLPADERDRQRLELLLPLAFSLSILGRFREILDLLLAHREHLERLQEPPLAGPYYFRLGLTYSYLGNHEQAAQNAHHAIEEATRCNDESTMGKAHYVLALTSFWTGQSLQGVDHGRQAVALLERTEEQNWLGLAHWILGLNYLLLGEFAPALEAEERTRTIAEAIADPRLQSFAAWSSGWIYAVRGDWEAGIEACQRGLERSPDPVNTAGALSYTGYAYLEKGDPAQAILLLEQSVQQFGQLRMRQSQGRVLAWLSEAYFLNGDLEKARALAIQGLATSREVQSRWGIGWAQRVLGRIAQTSGTLAEAETHLTEALQTFASMPARFEVGRTHLALAELAHAQGNQKAVATHLKEAHHLFKALQAPKHLEQTEHLVKVLGLSLAVDVPP